MSQVSCRLKGIDMDISEQVEEAIDYLQKCQAYIAKDNAIEAWYWLQNALRDLREIQTPLSELASLQDKEEEEKINKREVN